MATLDEQLQKFVDDAEEQVTPDRETKQAMTLAGAKVLADALKEAAPVSNHKHERYGHLRDNIAVDDKDIDGTENGNSVAGFHQKGYVARFLNDGTIKMPATHWVDKTRREVADNVFQAEHKVYQERKGGGK